MTSVLVVCPSVTVAHAEHFSAVVQAAMDKGADLSAVLVANDAGTQALAERWPNIVVPGSNVGFAASINLGAAERDFAWLVIANDDMEIDTDSIVQLAEHLAGQAADRHRLIRLTGELPWRRIPGPLGVFTGLSLLEKLPNAFGRKMVTESLSPSSSGIYAPFTLVAVSRSLWLDVSGLDEALPFCYEDAWFMRNAVASAEGVELGTLDLGVHHLHSVSTGSRIDAVLPVISWSALVYLELIGVRPFAARAVCLVALLIRAPLSLGGRAERRKHLRGVWGAISAIVAGRRPALPAPHDEPAR